MSDIVERLRIWRPPEIEEAARVLDAANEIERLREGERAADAEIERLRGLVDACSIFLKEDETPAQRIERERADTEAVLKLLLKEKRDNERLREEVKLLNSFRPDAELARLRELLREGLSEHVRLHVHPYFPAWEKRVREALGD